MDLLFKRGAVPKRWTALFIFGTAVSLTISDSLKAALSLL